MLRSSSIFMLTAGRFSFALTMAVVASVTCPDLRAQHGAELPTTTRSGGAKGGQNPQFDEREFVVAGNSEGIELGGTLTVPSGEGPFPAVILLSVAGPNDRDQAFADHAGFKVLAEFLSTHGIAVARFDDRGVGKSTGDYFGASWNNLAEDALAILQMVKKHKQIDSKRMGFAGMSQGGAVAAIAAARSNEVAFLVLMSAPGLSGKQTLEIQLNTMLTLSGIEGAMAQQYRQQFADFIEIVSGDPKEAETRQRLRTFLDGPGRALIPPYQFIPKELEARVDMFLSPWYRSNVLFDPIATYGALQLPILILGGSSDPVAPPDAHVSALVKILGQSPKAEVTAKLLPGVNHIMQNSKTGLPTEYASLDNSIAPAVLPTIRDWINESLRQRGGDAGPRAN